MSKRAKSKREKAIYRKGIFDAIAFLGITAIYTTMFVVAILKQGGQAVIEIIILDNRTKIKTNDIEIFIEGNFEIKKNGAEAPIISEINNQQ